MYKRLAVPPLCLDVYRLTKTAPGAVALSSVVGITALTFLSYNSFFYDSEKSALAGFRDLVLMMAVGGIGGFQTLAIKQLDTFPFFGALVTLNILGQLAELSLYDTIKSATLYKNHPILVALMTAFGMGALKVSGQIIGKTIASDANLTQHLRQRLLTWGVCAVTVGLVVSEGIRENISSDKYLENTGVLTVFSLGLFAISGSQSIGTKTLSTANYPYFAASRQVLSALVGFELNLQLTKATPFFDSGVADLFYRASIVASLKISGYMAGRDHALNAANENSQEPGTRTTPTETTPLLSPEV